MKKMILLALAAVSAVVLALPAMASAMIPLHLNPTPAGSKTIDGVGSAVLSTSGGTTTTCTGFGGSASFEAGGTTGTMNLTFTGCKESVFGTSCNSSGAASGTIVTTSLPFHLATLAGKSPGVLVTPNAGGAGNHFATFTCAGGLVTVNVTGNGVLGTITAPACGTSSATATIKFEQSANGVQKHKTLEGTATEYSLMKGAETAAQSAHGTLTLGSESQLVCT